MNTPAHEELLQLVTKIGPGFHPDTRGDDYNSLPDGITPEDVDWIVEAAFAEGVDVYGVALDAINTAIDVDAARAHRTRPLYEHVAEMFPNAEMVYQGRPVPDSADIPWGDTTRILITEDETRTDGGWLVGIYPDPEECEGSAYFTFGPDVPDLLRYLDTITEITPEDVDWSAWAEQWTDDAIADGRLNAERL